MELISPLAEEYAISFTSAQDALLAEIDLYTRLHHPKAHMLSGHVQGRFLAFLSKIIKPERILEIGTFTGFSALCLAEGLQKGGELHTIELRNDDAQIAAGYFARSAFDSQIHLHIGDARSIIQGMGEKWDIVFIDADKTGYIDYYKLTLPAVKKNGLIIADNVLFHGEVLKENMRGKNAKAIQQFNTYVKDDITTEQVFLTLRDGLLIVRKK